MLNEAVIRRAVGGTEVMRARLHHIAELAGIAQVNVQVLPFALERTPPWTGHSAS